MKKVISRIITFCSAVLLSFSNAVEHEQKVVRSFAASSGGRDYVIVSLGDSYSAGEGNEPFFGQNSSDKHKNPDWVAHRSEKAWSGRLSIDTPLHCYTMQKDKNWFFVADSGAEVPHISGARKKPLSYYTLSKNGTPYLAKSSLTLPAQITVFEKLNSLGLKADYVTMTMGGNDMKFVEVVKEAAIYGRINPNNFTDKLNERCKKIDDVVISLKSAYREISKEAGTQATILIGGYPTLMDPNGSFWFPKNNAVNVNNKIRLFNAKIHIAVNELREHEKMSIYYVSVDEEGLFKGHEACTDDPYLNGIKQIQRQDIELNANPISSYSMHPNEKGLQAYASAMQKAINECEASRTEKSDKQEIKTALTQEQAAIYSPVLQEFIKAHGMPKKPETEESVFGGTFCRILDFNQDGVPELYLANTNDTYPAGPSRVYTIQNGKAVMVYENKDYYAFNGDIASCIYYDTEKKQYGIMKFEWGYDGWTRSKQLFDGSKFYAKKNYIEFNDYPDIDKSKYKDYVVVKPDDSEKFFKDVLLYEVTDENINSKPDIPKTIYECDKLIVNYGYHAYLGVYGKRYEYDLKAYEISMDAYNQIVKN